MAAAVGASVTVWLAGGLGSWLGGRGWPRGSVGMAGAVLVRLALDPLCPRAAWPPAARAGIPPAPAFYLLVAVTAVAALSGLLGARRVLRCLGLGGPGRLLGRGGEAPRGATWATGRELGPLVVAGATHGRIVLGRSGRRLLAGEPNQSVIVVGPTQTSKTTGFAIPAILEWDGPVLATSVKSDLVCHTLCRRESLGQVWVYDPTGSSGLEASGWSPLASSSTWPGARRMASALCGTARSRSDATAESDFWYSTAAKLIAPLLFAAASSGRTIRDVVQWVDTHEIGEVASVLTRLGVDEAQQAAEATWSRDERQLGSVYATAENVLEAFADPVVAASAAHPEIEPDRLLDGRAHTLYVSAPSHEQSRVRAAFVGLVSEVLASAYMKVGRDGRPLEKPLLVVLDEAANVAPLGELDALAATAAGHGIQLVTIWQDMAQIAARYGQRSATVVNNHRAKVVLSGISDPLTLEHVSALLGDEELTVSSTTTDGRGTVTTTSSTATRRLAPAGALRRIRPGSGVLVYGHLPPARLELRPWYRDRRLSALARP